MGVLGVSNGHRGKIVSDGYSDIMRVGIDGLPPSESGGSGGTSSEILMMGRMMGNRYRTCHEALFHGKLLLPPLRHKTDDRYPGQTKVRDFFCFFDLESNLFFVFGE